VAFLKFIVWHVDVLGQSVGVRESFGIRVRLTVRFSKRLVEQALRRVKPSADLWMAFSENAIAAVRPAIASA
jgi:hypothetical protein